MAEPGLQLEQRHRLLGVVELAGDGGAGTVAGDPAPHVAGGDAGLGAQCGNDRAVDVAAGNRLAADGEEHVDVFAGFAVDRGQLCGSRGLPGLDGLPEQRIDGFGERGPGLVHGHVDQADGVGDRHVAGVGGDRCAVVLPAHAADPQPGQFVAAQAAEQPGECDRADQRHRVVGVGGVGGQVVGFDVQPGPQQLRPHVVGDDDPRVGADQRGDAARHRQRAGGVEAAREPLPFLAVVEEGPAAGQDVSLGAWGDRGADACGEAVAALHVVADPHPVHGGDPGRAGLSGPLARFGDLGVLGHQPPPGLGHLGADGGADPGGSVSRSRTTVRPSRSTPRRRLRLSVRGCVPSESVDRSGRVRRPRVAARTAAGRGVGWWPDGPVAG